ncbi:hypothetical protein [Streptomyces sp. AM 2-1-1]|uniref:hypothetical protein n=1 Tax=Streptomyces sp. AM 2-1-1 TaxID=3028709 RepID=UPI0023B94F9C|nr:hypothetical protein [Streptomyces sp. AM 2-1-1]WEH43944.1 hypothetical protein PZB77_30415 [Streptomyces sp. AM 2-1-1]
MREAKAGFRSIGRSRAGQREKKNSEDGHILGPPKKKKKKKKPLEIMRGFAQLYR